MRKELWTPHEGQRLHTRLLSDSSRLTLARGIGKEEVVEEMQGVVLFTQEEMKEGFQWVRVVIADEATYYFKDERVVAEKVKLFRFKLPGGDLPEEFPAEKPLMEGEAKWVEFILSKAASMAQRLCRRFAVAREKNFRLFPILCSLIWPPSLP